MHPRYSILLPAFNEQETIDAAIRETSRVFTAHKQPFEILMIDDASTDETVARAESIQPAHTELRLIKIHTNLGKGGAIARGVEEARGDIILFLDCDLSVSPIQALESLKALTDSDVLIGSRRVPGAHIRVPQAWWRTDLGRVFNAFVRHMLHLPYNDTQCGFKAFRRDVAKQVFSNLHVTRWAFDLEILLRAKNAHMRIIEVPVDWKNGRTSRVRFSHSIQLFRDLLLLRRTYVR